MSEQRVTPKFVANKEFAARNLLDRRAFLKGGALATSALAFSQTVADERKPWMRSPGLGMEGHSSRSRFEADVIRVGNSSQPGTTGSGGTRTPLDHLQGTITPSGLHFERHHSGVPDIDPDQHSLTVHGAVGQPLRFSLEALDRYPHVTRQCFIECSGNSAVQLSPQPVDRSVSVIHGLVSQSEWTGVPVRYLLEEAGINEDASWVIAEGADAARLNRSIPLEKMLDDALIALYQNGERIRPQQGYPMRLLLPGYEGNTSVKWLHRLQVANQPALSRQETSKYTDIYTDGRAEVFTFPMQVKSVITAPSPGHKLQEKGIYEIRGLAWSGEGKISKVEVSADAGQSWADAIVDGPILDKSAVRFRLPWRWDGAPCHILSRAYDAQGRQPTRDEILRDRGNRFFYHYNAIQAWAVSADGTLTNAYV